MAGPSTLFRRPIAKTKTAKIVKGSIKAVKPVYLKKYATKIIVNPEYMKVVNKFTANPENKMIVNDINEYRRELSAISKGKINASEMKLISFKLAIDFENAVKEINEMKNSPKKEVIIKMLEKKGFHFRKMFN